MIRTKFIKEKSHIHNISLSPIKGTSEYNSRSKSGFSNGPNGNKVSNLELNKSVRSETNKRISDIAEFRMSCKSKVKLIHSSLNSFIASKSSENIFSLYFSS
jgi:hypothetical protein